MKKWLLTALAGLLAAGEVSAAAEFQYFVVPIRGITGISQSAASKGQGPKYSGMIQEEYADIFFDEESRRKIEERFLQSTINAFKGSVVGANQVVESGAGGKYAYQPFDQKQCKPDFTVDYRDAYAISVGISRLSVYLNDFRTPVGEVTQILIPITYTVRFLAIDGATVIFSKSETITTALKDMPSSEVYADRSAKKLKPNIIADLKAAIQTDALVMVDRQVDYAAKSFKPRQNQVNVIYKDKEFIVFDKGSEVGFTSGEAFDADDEKYMSFMVRYTTEGLTVAQAVGGEMSQNNIAQLREGSKLKFSFTKQGLDDAKPSVLAVQYSIEPLTAGQIQANALQTILSDSMGFKTPFNFLKQDPDFERFKVQIRDDINCSSAMWSSVPGFADNTTVKRKDPDLFLKLDFYNSPVYTSFAETGVTNSNFFQSSITLSLIDKANVIRQNFSATEAYENKRTDGKGLSLAQAQEVNLKNATLAATKAMVDGFKLQRKTVKINALSNGQVTLSETVPNNMFELLSLVRPLNVGKKTLLVPIPQSAAKLEPAGQDSAIYKVTLDQFGDKSNLLKSTDMVLVSGEINTAPKLKYCDLARKRLYLPANFRHGSGTELNTAQLVALGSKKYQWMQQHKGFTESMNSALKKGFFESSQIHSNSDAETSLCMLPIEVVQPGKVECATNKCEGSIDLTTGLRIYDGDKKINELAEGRKVIFKDVRVEDMSSFVGYKLFEQQRLTIKDFTPKL